MFGFPVEKVQLRLHFFLPWALAPRQHNPNNCSSRSAGSQGTQQILRKCVFLFDSMK